MLSVPVFVGQQFLHVLQGPAQEGRHFLVFLSCTFLDTQDASQPVAAMGKSAPKGGESPSLRQGRRKVLSQDMRACGQ